ncbi:hypothetical protein [Glaciimonas soli]|uniref:DUF2946 domain-containing protein n=1 Tax=Glaciimonas soli TaxID=2590999 RepID=A0A843YMX4_9BURK|nr:hypothetical protein [Glaciimonas soli]MQQ99123.1 hypothetical protein [Glaciimonas soli]
MQLIINDTYSSKRNRKIRWRQFAFWLVLSILVIQLVAAAFHNHGLTEKSDDCAACSLAANLPSPTPTPPVVAPTAALVFVYPVAIEAIYFLLLPPSHYLTPLAQAPPSLSSPFQIT